MNFNNVLVVNDIPGAGKVAANVNIPILTAAELEVALLPTVLLSTQTGGTYSEIVRHEMGEDFQAMLQHWVNNDIRFAAYLTGYFSNPTQVDIFTKYYEEEKATNPSKQLMMDPIMGDNGVFYDGFDQKIAQKLSLLTSKADIVMPNITEACLMTGYPYNEYLTVQQLDELSDLLLQTGVKYTVITGVRFPDEEPDKIGFYLKGQELAGQWINHQYYSDFYFGTGDIAVSSIVAWYSKGETLISAIEKTGPIIEEVIERTDNMKRAKRFGLYFEPSLKHFIN